MATVTEQFPDLKVESEVSRETIEAPATPVVAETQELTEDEKREALEIAQEHKKSKGGGQRKIDKLHRANKELEEQLAEARAAAALHPKPNGDAAPTARAEQEPREEDFASYKEFVKAQARWEIRQFQIEEEKKEAEQEQAEQAREIMDAYYSKFDAVREKYPDFDEVAKTTTAIEFRDQNAMRSFDVCVKESDSGPEIIYYLEKNPDERGKFLTMSAARVAIEIGRIDAKLQSGSLDEKKIEAKESKAEVPASPVSKAPPPIVPLGGSSRGEKPLAELDPDEYRRVRDEQLRKQGKKPF